MFLLPSPSSPPVVPVPSSPSPYPKPPNPSNQSLSSKLILFQFSFTSLVGTIYFHRSSAKIAVSQLLCPKQKPIIEAKVKVLNNSDSTGDDSIVIDIYDGTANIELQLHDYYILIYPDANSHYVQVDLSKPTSIKIVGKGSDVYVYVDNKLVFDGTGLLTGATALNRIDFGDISSVAGQNGSAEWHYIKYYEGEYLPEYSSMQLSEYAYWSEDKSSLLPLIYNSGDIQSVKELTGMNENYVESIKQVISVKGITINPTTTVLASLPEMNGFVFGRSVSVSGFSAMTNNIAERVNTLYSYLDGKNIDTAGVHNSGASHKVLAALPYNPKHIYSGLHYACLKFSPDADTITATTTQRSCVLEAE